MWKCLQNAILLLLGNEKNGKSTIYRQIQLLFGEPITNHELLNMKSYLHRKLNKAMKNLAKFSDLFHDDQQEIHTKVSSRKMRLFLLKIYLKLIKHGRKISKPLVVK